MKAYIIPEVPLWKLLATALFAFIIGAACIIVYDHITVNTLAKLRAVEDRVAVLEAEARPLVWAHDSTVNYFLANGEKVREGDNQ